ncbi:MAG: protein-L-isoaspartate(D-aspartate) O-methyltransferase [Chitinophagales bacterium]|nr:protein-L-isoaspartate(D-aspartate) O-methyltransferase [Chitinophagales bacterium]
MSELIDTYRHQGLRLKLAESIRKKGITDEAVLKAIETLPRHYFLDKAFLESAYEDKAFQIGEGQTISQPYTVAYQTQLLQVKKRDKVLEIGTGSGYQASILSAMGARVYTIERQKKLFDKTQLLLEKMRVANVKMFYGDGFEGKEAFAPYDKILITAAAPEIPKKLLQQLKIGGVMVLPFGVGAVQTMLRITKVSETEFEKEEFEDFKFVPMLKGKVS